MPEVYLPAEFIVVSGFVSRAMYFIARGRVQIIRRDRSAANNMRVEETYDYFDESGLFTEQQHSISARSITHTDLYKLGREQFEKIIRDFPAAGWLVASSAHRHMPGPQARMISKAIGELVGMPNVGEAHAEAVRRSLSDTGRRPSLEDLSETAKATPLQSMQVTEEAPEPEDGGKFGAGTLDDSQDSVPRRLPVYKEASRNL